MINITVKLPVGREVYCGNLNKGLAETVEAAKLLYPDWSSMVIVLSNTTKK